MFDVKKKFKITEYLGVFEAGIMVILLLLNSFETLRIPWIIFNVYFGVFIVFELIIWGFGFLSYKIAKLNIEDLKTNKKGIPSLFKISFNSMYTTIFVLLIIFELTGVVKVPTRTFVLYIVSTLLPTIVGKIMALLLVRKFQMISTKEFYLLKLMNSEEELIREYKAMKDNLLLDTNIKENPKMFKDLCSEYYRKILRTY